MRRKEREETIPDHREFTTFPMLSTVICWLHEREELIRSQGRGLNGISPLALLWRPLSFCMVTGHLHNNRYRGVRLDSNQQPRRECNFKGLVFK